MVRLLETMEPRLHSLEFPSHAVDPFVEIGPMPRDAGERNHVTRQREREVVHVFLKIRKSSWGPILGKGAETEEGLITGPG